MAIRGLVFDFDDAIWLQNASDANRRLAWLKSPSKTADLIAMSDLVLAGNAYLADYASAFSDWVEVFARRRHGLRRFGPPASSLHHY